MLASNTATSEDFVYEFLKCHPCEYLFQVHSIAPLLTAEQVAAFTKAMRDTDYDVLLSAVNEPIECTIDRKGQRPEVGGQFSKAGDLRVKKRK